MQPWDRMENESPMQYRRFCHYLNSVDPMTGKRSIRELAEAFGIGMGALYGVSARWKWHERAKAYDLDELKRGGGRPAGRLNAAARRLGKEVDKMLAKGADGMSAAELAKLIDVIGKMQKLMGEESGAAEEIGETEGPEENAGLENLTDAELIRLNELLEKAGPN